MIAEKLQSRQERSDCTGRAALATSSQLRVLVSMLPHVNLTLTSPAGKIGRDVLRGIPRLDFAALSIPIQSTITLASLL
jgi:hypothetical protein